jgi:hypothetical protein
MDGSSYRPHREEPPENDVHTEGDPRLILLAVLLAVVIATVFFTCR